MFQNKIALVTAGAQGIGQACAALLAKRGAKVYIADWKKDLADEAAETIRKNGGKSEGLFFDAGDKKSYAAMIETVFQKERGIDVLINNFGGTNPQTDRDIINTEVDIWENNLLNNLNSVFIPCKLVIPRMIQNGGGSIVNISSLSSLCPDLTSIAYGIIKNSVNYFTKQTAIQYARQGVRCNAVLPGMIATKAVADNLPQQMIDGFLQSLPIQRMGSPEDIAEAVAFLASPAASYITGVLLPVTGGMELTSARYPEEIKKQNI